MINQVLALFLFLKANNDLSFNFIMMMMTDIFKLAEISKFVW